MSTHRSRHPRRPPAVQSLVIPNPPLRPQSPKTAQPPPLTPTVARSGKVGEAVEPKLTSRGSPFYPTPTGGGGGCSSRKGTSRTKSGVSPAVERPERMRPQTSATPSRLGRGFHWAALPSQTPQLTAATPGAAGWACVPPGVCQCRERGCWRTVALGITAAAAASPGSSQYPLSSPSTPLCCEVSKSPPASAPPPRPTSTPSPLPCEAPAPLHL